MSCLYILEINPSSVALFANIFSHSEGRLLILFMVSHSSVGKESACNAGDLGLIPGLGRSPGEEKGYPLQYSGQENSTDCIVNGVAKSQTQ